MCLQKTLHAGLVPKPISGKSDDSFSFRCWPNPFKSSARLTLTSRTLKWFVGGCPWGGAIGFRGFRPMLPRKSVGPAAGATVGRWRKMGDNRRKPHTMCSFKPLRVSHTTSKFCYHAGSFVNTLYLVHGGSKQVTWYILPSVTKSGDAVSV